MAGNLNFKFRIAFWNIFISEIGRSKKHIALSEKKPPLVKSRPLWDLNWIGQVNFRLTRAFWRIFLNVVWDTWFRAWFGNLKQGVPITSKFSKFKGETQPYVVKLPKSVGARHYCPKILRVPGTPGTRSN